MKVSFKSLLYTLLGILTGFTIVFIVKGFKTGEFEWQQWFFWMVGGVLAYQLIFFLLKNRDKK
ncbi:hypothetical protein VBD025_16380 [Virgibacillus flavescens]|uniref:hypothetical protein n=1 Tax=Virgibacillus flavescens TaxID=1611422 RepID=UPI003D338C9F